VNARMTFDELRDRRYLPTKSRMGHRGSSRCSFMAPFCSTCCVPSFTGWQWRNNALHLRTCSPSLPRARRPGEVSCMPCLLGCMLGESFMVGLGCPPCKKDRNHTKARGSESEMRERCKYYWATGIGASSLELASFAFALLQLRSTALCVYCIGILH
jgi:hypothetical protein